MWQNNPKKIEMYLQQVAKIEKKIKQFNVVMKYKMQG